MFPDSSIPLLPRPHLIVLLLKIFYTGISSLETEAKLPDPGIKDLCHLALVKLLG